MYYSYIQSNIDAYLRHEADGPLDVIGGGGVSSRCVLAAEGALLHKGLGEHARLGQDRGGQHLVYISKGVTRDFSWFK